MNKGSARKYTSFEPKSKEFGKMSRCRNWSAAISGTIRSAACGAAPAHFSVTTGASNGCYKVGGTAPVAVGIKGKRRCCPRNHGPLHLNNILPGTELVADGLSQ